MIHFPYYWAQIVIIYLASTIDYNLIKPCYIWRTTPFDVRTAPVCRVFTSYLPDTEMREGFSLLL